MANDLVEVTSNQLVSPTWEKQWAKKLTNSGVKRKEWTIKHALDIHNFYEDAKTHEAALPAELKIYARAKLNEWLGYSESAVSQWLGAGRFLADLDDQAALLGRTNELPGSTRALYELSTLDPDQLQLAYDAGLISSSTTVKEVSEFKAELKAKKALEEPAKAEPASSIDEGSLLFFQYDGKIPSWIVGKIEDMVHELGEEAVRGTPTMKFPLDTGGTWVMTLFNDLWEGTFIPKNAPQVDDLPREEKPTRPSAPAEAAAADQPSLGVMVSPAVAKHLGLLGVNLKKGYVEKWALEALVQAAYSAYTSDDLKIEAAEAAEELKRK
jgi:hypothetical protein